MPWQARPKSNGRASAEQYRQRMKGLYSTTHMLGQPRAGKTTFLKYLVLPAATGKLDRVPETVKAERARKLNQANRK